MARMTLDLSGKWEFKQYPLSARRMRDLDPADWMQTKVPSSIFSSLISAGQIKQTDIDTYPENYSWVSEKPWVYRKKFDAPAQLLACEKAELVFEGLDTIAKIWLNGKLIAKTNNMFIPFRFDVTTVLKPRNNSLLVKFEPAVQYAKKLMERYGCFNETNFRNPHRAYIRKAQYQFGWDFCPELPGCGIWRPVRLEGIQKARLADLHVRTIDCNHKYADVKITAKLDGVPQTRKSAFGGPDTVSAQQFLCRVTLSGGAATIEHKLAFEPGEDSKSTVIHIEKPSLWWPAGYGKQNLYQLTVKLLNEDEVIDQAQKEFGIRTAKLNYHPDGGGEFRFEINGQPVLARGANWIPASLFAGSVDADDYEQLLGAAEKCNINMLRVWGGGYYEADEFYRLCDRLGIMVWQDFMFACAYYPDRQWFTTEVKKECTEIIKQLRNHPCLVLWCGNNEIDWMHSTGLFGRGKKFYGKAIYHQLLPKLIRQLDPDTDYIPTTPLEAEGKSKTADWLTMHQWDVWSRHQPTRQYLCPAGDVPRFVTEFGLQALPDMKTVKSFCPSRRLYIGSQTLEKHNYQLDGNSRLYRYMGDLFGTAETIEQFVYLSQITQARAVKAYVEHLRAHSRRNSGVLFWQLNDCCPAISWSAIDHRRNPKALYYYAKRFFSKLLISVVPVWDRPKAELPPTLQSLNVIAINDTDKPVTAVLNCRLIDLFARVLDCAAFPLTIAPFSTSISLKLPREIAFPPHPDKSALHLLMTGNDQKIAENLFFYLPDKYIDWPGVKITKYLYRIADRKWKMKLQSNAVAKDVQISGADPVQFSNNFFDLVPPDELEVTIECQQQSTSIESQLQLRCLKSRKA